MITHARMTFRQVDRFIAEAASTNIAIANADLTLICSSGSIRINVSTTPTTSNSLKLSEGESLDIQASNVYMNSSGTGKYQAVVWK